eukprot:gnl/MRDRNA2_/MRDRNA2_202650_c0_seq1.p1 gnl/MRDRNA2_/MRDRNA2_202650_c0~~gnl/MRDRNA2_/MRDRNA2_202650_c0_seq1.p1  ORF type:complete len:144 (-),score=28.27 gnl/MRDRNA2_/MRDRNA2_202650_c0_seq1:103-534(-)
MQKNIKDVRRRWQKKCEYQQVSLRNGPRGSPLQLRLPVILAHLLTMLLDYNGQVNRDSESGSVLMQFLSSLRGQAHFQMTFVKPDAAAKPYMVVTGKPVTDQSDSMRRDGKDDAHSGELLLNEMETNLHKLIKVVPPGLLIGV